MVQLVPGNSCGTSINWSNPLAMGLRALWSFGQSTGFCYDLVSRVEAVPGDSNFITPSVRMSSAGSGVNFDGVNDSINTQRSGNRIITAELTAVTLWSLFVPDTSAVSGRMLNIVKTGASTCLAIRVGNVSGQFGGMCRDSADSFLAVNGGTVANGSPQTIGFCLPRDGAAILYGNGREVSRSTSAHVANTLSPDSTVARIGSYENSLDFFDGIIHIIGIWGRALSQQEFASLHANPWQLLAVPSVTRFFVPAAAGGGLFRGSLASMGVGV